MIEKLIGLVRYIASDPWFLVGYFGQALFMMRFVVQWVHSERRKQSLVPVAFWFFSVGGGLVLLAYAIYRRDPVIIPGQALGMVIYMRNLWLIYRPRKELDAQSRLERAIRLSDELAVELRGLGTLAQRPKSVDRTLAELSGVLSGRGA